MTEPRAIRPYMPGYGVPDDLDGVLPWAWALERLARCRNYWLITASASSRPHALPVWGVWLDTRPEFVFSCAASSRKSRDMRENPQVCVTVDDTVECVSVEGHAARVFALDDRPELIDAYVDKYVDKNIDPSDTNGVDAARRELADFVDRHELWRVMPEHAIGIIERAEEFGARATKWVW